MKTRVLGLLPMALSLVVIACGPGSTTCQLDINLDGYKKGDATITVSKDSREAAPPQKNLFADTLKFDIDCQAFPSPLEVSVVSSKGVQMENVECDCASKKEISFGERDETLGTP